MEPVLRDRYNEDKRDLFEIPVVRAFGIISYLDFTTTFDSSVPAIAKDAWGVAEVWLCGEGRLRKQVPLTVEFTTPAVTHRSDGHGTR